VVALPTKHRSFCSGPVRAWPALERAYVVEQYVDCSDGVRRTSYGTPGPSHTTPGASTLPVAHTVETGRAVTVAVTPPALVVWSRDEKLADETQSHVSIPTTVCGRPSERSGL